MQQRFLVFLSFLLGAAACQTDGMAPAVDDPPAGASSETASRAPRLLRPAADAPSLANADVSFYAKAGDSRRVSIWYHARPGRTDSTEFVRFKVGAKSLLRLPDGTPVAPGDSVLIRLTVVDPAQLIVDFQPAGLRFNPRDPAEIRMSYAETHPDVNQDGIVNQQDTTLTRKLRIWRQETETDPWLALASEVVLETHEVEAEINGFTRYAVAY